MNNEYVIINKTAIQKRIDEWEIELQECFKAPVGKFNSEYVSTLQQAIATARDFLSQSTPLIPEIEKAFEQGQNSVEARMEYKPINGDVDWYAGKKITQSKQDYISNLKLDI